MVYDFRTNTFDVFDGFGKASGGLARSGIQMLQGGPVWVALVEVDSAAQRHDAIGAILAGNDLDDAGTLHLCNDVVVGTVQFGDILRLGRHSWTVEERVSCHMRADGDVRGQTNGRLGIAVAVGSGGVGVRQ